MSNSRSSKSNKSQVFNDKPKNIPIVNDNKATEKNTGSKDQNGTINPSDTPKTNSNTNTQNENITDAEKSQGSKKTDDSNHGNSEPVDENEPESADEDDSGPIKNFGSKSTNNSSDSGSGTKAAKKAYSNPVDDPAGNDPKTSDADNAENIDPLGILCENAFDEACIKVKAEIIKKDLLFKASDQIVDDPIFLAEQAGYLSTLKTPDLRKQEYFVGISNKGNSCYAGSILQMLYRFPAIRTFIGNLDVYSAYIVKTINEFYVNCKFESSMFKYEQKIEALKFLIGLNHIFYQLQNNTKGQSVKFSFQKSMLCMPGKFAQFKQEDSDEYLAKVFDSLKELIPYDERPQMFSFQLTKHPVNQQERMVEDILESLRVPIPAKDKTLAGALKQYFQDQPTLKDQKLVSVPQILLIQLRRIVIDPKRRKICDAVEMPFEVDMKDYYTPGKEVSSQSTKFRLKMFVEHQGDGSDNGHFIAYSREDNGSLWVKLDDSTVSTVSEATAMKVSRNAYYFFYEKLSE